MMREIDLVITDIPFSALATDDKAIFLKSQGFELVFCNKYAFISIHREKGMIACVLLEEYIPIDRFKYVFNELALHIKNGQFKRFVFDKRSLRTFHQPTMEWYFLDWKEEVFQHGITQHYKILPELDWFVTAVEVAREPLIQKLSDRDFAKLDIRYCNSLEEAITD